MQLRLTSGRQCAVMGGPRGSVRRSVAEIVLAPLEALSACITGAVSAADSDQVPTRRRGGSWCTSM